LAAAAKAEIERSLDEQFVDYRPARCQADDAP
jgi:hypothetical protein